MIRLICEKLFVTDLSSLRPTLMAAVPAILDLISNGLKKKFATTGVKGKLADGAVQRRMGRPAGCGAWVRGEGGWGSMCVGRAAG